MLNYSNFFNLSLKETLIKGINNNLYAEIQKFVFEEKNYCKIWTDRGIKNLHMWLKIEK